ncbi:MAG: triple tyrosine motif-containing protein, partial [Limisphaerales bacterium]
FWGAEDGGLGVAPAGGRLACLEGEVWSVYSLREGLKSRSLSYLGGDGRGGLWVGSNTGMMRLGLEQLSGSVSGNQGKLPMRVYRLPDGLPTPECTEGSQPGLCLGKDGRLWFTTVEGLVGVDPANLEVNPVPPAVVIESVEIEDVALRTNLLEMRWPETVVVPPGRERVEVHYTSLNLRSPDRAQFRYRMDGYESRWTEAGDALVARYTKLPPGEYGFHLQASNEDGVWNEEGARLSFVVLPPFWRTWWFLGGMTTLVLAIGAGIVWYTATQRMRRQVGRLRQQQALERERARIARDLHDQLGASLTQISLLGEMADADRDLPEEVSGYARQITQTSRETAKVLDEIVWAVNPSNDTLDGLMTYFCKNAQEYLAVAGVRVRLEVPTQLPEVVLPPDVRHNFFLAAKEAVTNVVRHARATEARIRLQVGEARIVLEVQDNGSGLGGMDPERAARRNGLKNMRKRMQDVGGEFELGDAESGGAVVRLTVPRSVGGKMLGGASRSPGN